MGTIPFLHDHKCLRGTYITVLRRLSCDGWCEVVYGPVNLAAVAQGFGRGTQGEFVQFLGYGIGSLDETRSHLSQPLIASTSRAMSSRPFLMRERRFAKCPCLLSSRWSNPVPESNIFAKYPTGENTCGKPMNDSPETRVRHFSRNLLRKSDDYEGRKKY